MRLMFAGLTKFLVKNEEGGWTFDTENAKYVMSNITSTMETNTAIPAWSLGPYATFLPWALLIKLWAICKMPKSCGIGILDCPFVLSYVLS